MAKLKIIKYGDPRLRKKSVIIQKLDKKLAALERDMTETMLAARGIGLAAPQIGKNIQFSVMKLERDSHDEIVGVVNPEILAKSEEEILGEEGCLSIPGVYEKIKRPKWIKVKYTTINNGDREETLSDLNARLFCHEVDHLLGVLFIDYLKKE